MDVGESSGWDGDGLYCWQFLTQAATSLLRPCYITLAAIIRLVARVPAWASP